MNLTVDASVFVAAARVGERHYQISFQFLQQVRAQLVSLVETFPRLQFVPVDLSLARRAGEIAREHRLRGADAVYVSVAETSNSVLIAWDAEMLERGANVVTAMTPLEWMEEQTAT